MNKNIRTTQTKVDEITFWGDSYNVENLLIAAKEWLSEQEDFGLLDMTYQADERGARITLYGYLDFTNKKKEMGK